MLKEKGYDEYLAKKVQQGLTESEEGKVLTLAEANAQWQAVIDQFELENQQFAREIVYA